MTELQELHRQIESSLKELRERCKSDSHPYALSASRLLAEVFAASAQLTEISTRRIIRLTYWLLGFTVGLFLITLSQLAMEVAKHSDKPDNHANLNNHGATQQTQPKVVTGQSTNH